MKDIGEFDATVSPYEVLVHLNDRILSGELKTFEALKAYVSKLPEGPKTAAVVKRAFDLQRQLYWGFFKNVSPESFPDVWTEVVSVDRNYPFAGDLRRHMSIPTIYLGLLDIHGYTRFCRENRSNLSMLDLLDRMIQEDVARLAAKVGVVSRRARGDEILLLGAQASDLLEAALSIIHYFGARRRIKDGAAEASIDPKYDFVLPEFKVSAGLAGGQKYSSLVITRDGDLSGDIVNAAARLQARANKISPDHNKILLTANIYEKLKASVGGRPHERLDEVEFFDAGTVDFKGMSLGVYDVVFKTREAHRLEYHEAMKGLYESIDKGLWKSKVFEDSIALAVQAATNLPRAAKGPAGPGREADQTRHDFLAKSKSVLNDFRSERFEAAIAGFLSLVEDVNCLEGMDDHVVEYLKRISEAYAELLKEYVASLDREVETYIDSILSPQEKENFVTLRKHHALFETMRVASRLKVRNKKSIWYRVADESEFTTWIRLQSMK